MAIIANKIEFNLTIKKSADKNRDQYGFTGRELKPEYEVYEQLDFKGLSAVEVIRKLLDYINN